MAFNITDAETGNPKRTMQMVYSDGTRAALSFSNTNIAFDFYSGGVWTNIWTK